MVLRGGMGGKAHAAALARLQPESDGPPLLVVATGPYIGEGFDCPVLDTLLLAAPTRWRAGPTEVKVAPSALARSSPGDVRDSDHGLSPLPMMFLMLG